MDGQPRLLVADGAERFAADCKAEMCKKEDLIADETKQEWKEELAGRIIHHTWLVLT